MRQQQEAQIRAEQEEIRRQQEELLRQQQSIQNNSYNSSVANAGYTTPSYTDPTDASSYLNGFNNTGFVSTPGYGNEPQYETDDNDVKNTGPVLTVPSDYKKVVAFVGTNKVGTSFLVNTVGTLLATKGVKTSILDMTRNRGLYWFYSDDTSKRIDVVANCMSNLSNGIAAPVQVGRSRNLTLYTTVPKGREDNRKGYKHRTVVETAKKNCNLLIIDCDFTTPIEYLEQAQEIFLVQDLDLIKCKETVDFLKDMKSRGLDWSKLRLVINNEVKSKITAKKIRKYALMSYSDPYFTYSEDIEEIKRFITVPLDPQNYSVYIDAMEQGRIDYDKFTEPLKLAIEDLSTMVYGIPGKKKGLFS